MLVRDVLSRSRMGPALALVAGCGAAAAILAGLSPVAGFALAGCLVLLAATLLRSPVQRPEDSAEPIAAVVPENPKPSLDIWPGRALVESLPGALLVISPAGRITFGSPAAATLLPQLKTDAHFTQLIRAPAFVEAVNGTLSDGAPRSVQFTAHQGSERFFEVRTVMLPPDVGFGPEPQVVVQIDDRTQARKTEELRSDFIANASHELRTPLASIIGYIETLQHHAKDDPEAREQFLSIMARESGRMQRLVDDLMSLSRIELNEHVRPVDACSLNEIAAECASALVPIARQQGVDLQIDLAGSGGKVTGDRDQLYQVFTNLIDNAIKYAGQGSRVRVFEPAPSRANPNRVGVCVSDTGPGIPREHVHRLTERFYRVNVTSSRNKGGTGLGLAIVKHILNRHRGRLEITSHVGEGSAFTVWLPQEAVAVESDEPRPEPGVPVPAPEAVPRSAAR